MLRRSCPRVDVCRDTGWNSNWRTVPITKRLTQYLLTKILLAKNLIILPVTANRKSVHRNQSIAFASAEAIRILKDMETLARRDIVRLNAQ